MCNGVQKTETDTFSPTENGRADGCARVLHTKPRHRALVHPLDPVEQRLDRSLIVAREAGGCEVVRDQIHSRLVAFGAVPNHHVPARVIRAVGQGSVQQAGVREADIPWLQLERNPREELSGGFHTLRIRAELAVPSVRVLQPAQDVGAAQAGDAAVGLRVAIYRDDHLQQFVGVEDPLSVGVAEVLMVPDLPRRSWRLQEHGLLLHVGVVRRLADEGRRRAHGRIVAGKHPVGVDVGIPPHGEVQRAGDWGVVSAEQRVGGDGLAQDGDLLGAPPAAAVEEAVRPPALELGGGQVVVRVRPALVRSPNAIHLGTLL